MIKEAIKSRLLQLAAAQHNDAHSGAIPHDPIVTLLMEALAGELSRLHEFQDQMQSGILQHLASVLLNDTITCSLPGHTLLHGTPCDVTIIDQQHVFKDQGEGAVFIPVGTHKLFPVTLRHIFYPDRIVQLNEGLQQEIVIREPIMHDTSPRIILMAQTDTVPSDLCGFSIFLDIPEHLQESITPLLPLLSCKVNGCKATVERLFYHEIAGMPSPVPHAYTQQALNTYRSQVITITSCKLADQHVAAEPPIILQPFLQQQLIALPECNIWMELELPGISHEWITEIKCYINCFPAVNISSSEIIHEIHPLHKVFQLKCDDDFLCLGAVTDQDGTPFIQMTDKTSAELQPGELNLLHAEKQRMDKRGVVQLLEACIRGLREEVQLIGQLGHNHLLQILEELTQKINYLEEVVYPDQRRPAWPTIAFQPHSGSTRMTVQYYTTKGARLSTIPAFSKWQEQGNSIFLPNSIVNLTPVINGEPAPSPEKQVQLFRAQLYAQQRIVNGADVEQCCRTVLGPYFSSVRIEQGVALSPLPDQGYIRTIDVHITLDQSASNCHKDLLSYYRRVILQQLDENSVGLAGYRVFLIPP